MQHPFSRTELLLGADALAILENARVAVFGIGGVGGFAAEALARSGIGHIDLIDSDTVSLTNVNRQIVAAHSTLGRRKVDVMKERIADINPAANVRTFSCFYLPETKELFNFADYDYVVDAVDTVAAKIQLILQAKECGTHIICCMGAGNKLDPMRFRVADISETSVCPLARIMRQECKRRGIANVKTVYSTEPPRRADAPDEPHKHGRRSVPGSVAFVPSVAGLIIAGEVVKDLIGIR